MTTTSYHLVYERFMSKIQDYDLLEQIHDDNVEFAKEILQEYLKSATTHFTYTSINFEDVMDDQNEEFTVKLNSQAQEILARYMIVEYMSPKLLRTEIFEEKLGSKDFVNFSPGNLLKQLIDLRKKEEDRTNTLMLEYYYSGGA